MNKSVLVFFACIVIVISLFTGYNLYKDHQYNNVEPVDHYYLLSYLPSQREYDRYFGRYEYTEPKVKLEQIKTYYPTEKEAFDGQMEDLADRYKYLDNLYDETRIELKEKPDDILITSKMKAILDKFREEHFLIRITHVRSFDPEEALNMIKEHWNDPELEEYAKENKLDYSINRLYL